MLELPRHALHAARLALAHPVTGAPLIVEAPLPADLAAFWAELDGNKADTNSGGPRARVSVTEHDGMTDLDQHRFSRRQVTEGLLATIGGLFLARTVAACTGEGIIDTGASDETTDAGDGHDDRCGWKHDDAPSPRRPGRPAEPRR